MEFHCLPLRLDEGTEAEGEFHLRIVLVKCFKVRLFALDEGTKDYGPP